MPTVTLSLEQLPVDSLDASSASIFPHVDELLQQPEYQRSLLWVRRAPRDQLNYRSLQDYLFVQVFPKWRNACRRFYAGDGPPFRRILSLDEIARIELKLIHAIDQAHAAMVEARQVGWSSLQQ